MTIDGSAFGKPQIGPAYDEIVSNKAHLLKNMYWQEHFLPIINTKGLSLAESKEQLFDFINEALHNPENMTKANTALLASLGIAQNDFVVTNVGRIISWKGQDVFIKAMQKVVAVNPNVKGLLVGSFESGIGDSAFYNVLKQLISDLGLQKNIILTGDRKDVAQIINSSSLVVHTSIKPEPQGLVILEAMFCEKPVIVSNAGGSAELAQLYGAIATEPGNVDELAESILAVISNTGKYLANQLKLIQTNN
ncbi:unnamed protein product [Rotaria sordida]|uniref:Glycosyl transferase family 1 domain-containing protein n=1 Tax=Rotaria sordida TaxID=392033 RepID=A0A813RG41_9BILA|nr:unnamed protein product [Rotaria sordida]